MNQNTILYESKNTESFKQQKIFCLVSWVSTPCQIWQIRNPIFFTYRLWKIQNNKVKNKKYENTSFVENKIRYQNATFSLGCTNSFAKLIIFRFQSWRQFRANNFRSWCLFSNDIYNLWFLLHSVHIWVKTDIGTIS